MAEEKEITATREMFILLDITKRICGWYGSPVKEEQLVTNEMFPYQPEAGEELHRSFNLVEREWKCLYDGLIDHLSPTLESCDLHSKTFIIRMLESLNLMFFGSPSADITEAQPKQVLYWGIRRYNNQMCWVRRKPTPMEELQQKATELGLNPM